MTTLRLDSEARTIEFSAALAGELQPIEGKISYRLEQQGAQLSLVPTEVECSRQWLELLAKQMVADGALRFPVPSGIAETALKVLRV